MANWSNPTLTSLYTDFVSEVKNRDVDLALGLDPATTSPTNVPTNAIRWNSASYKYEKWNGSAWGDLSSKYIFTAVEVSGATVPANGMYLSATNTLNFATATTASRLTIDGSGNVNIDAGTFYVDAVNNRVGVGTTGPSYALHVLSSSTSSVKFGASSAIDTQALIGNSAGDLIIRTTSGGDSIIASDVGKYLAFGTNGVSEKLRLDASGNLGLGVTPKTWNSSFNTIQLGGTASIYGRASIAYDQAGFYSNAVFDATDNRWEYIADNSGAGLRASGYLQSAGVHAWYTAPSGTAGAAITFTQAMTLTADGNLGIGGTPVFYYPGSNNIELGAVLRFRGNAEIAYANSALNINNFASTPTIFYTANSERMRITSGGLVGIGTTETNGLILGFAPSVQQKNGINYVSSSPFTNTDIWGAGTAGGWAGRIRFWTSDNAVPSTPAMTLDHSGRLLVGTPTARANFFNSSVSALYQIEGANNTDQRMSAQIYGSADAASSVHIFAKHRSNSIGGTTLVSADDELGQISFQGSDGSQFVASAQISAFVDGTPGADDMPGRLVFSTTADGAASPTERARINNLGYMQGTVNGLGAGRIPAKQYYRLNTQYTGSNVNTAQSVFGVGVTLVGSTIYEFEALYLLAGTATNSCNMSYLFGGTATINNIMYSGAGLGQGGVLSTSDRNGGGFYSRVATAAQVTGTLLSAVTVSYIVKGTVSINAGGTFIPQYVFSAAPGNAFITDTGSYFSIWPLSASGTAVNIGSWA